MMKNECKTNKKNFKTTIISKNTNKNKLLKEIYK